MQFSQPITNIIIQRSSVRTYVQAPIDSKQETALKEFLVSQTNGPLRSAPLRFQLIAANPGDPETLKHLKTYGTIKHPAGFIIGAVGNRTKVEDFGYVMEQIILYATDLHLGTCWLGGTFKKSSFAGAIDIKKHETVPAVTSIGIIPEKLGLKDKFIRNRIKADKRLPWNDLFFDGNFATPLSQEHAAAYAHPLEMVRLGPSASNKQPWRIMKIPNSNTFHFYVQRNPKYTKQLKWLKAEDLQRMDIGIAMCHFELTAKEQGLSGIWHVADPSITPLPDHTEYVVSWEGK